MKVCDCHRQPMYWVRDGRYRAGGFWRCAVKRRETMRSYYWERMPFEVRARRAMKDRRSKALTRRRERHLRRAA